MVVGVVADDEDANLCVEREIGEEIGIDIPNNIKKIKYISKHFVQEDICRIWTYCYLLKLNEEVIKKIKLRDNEISSIE